MSKVTNGNFLFSAKSEDRNHQVGDKIDFIPATGNHAFYGEGIYLSDRVEVTYTRGAGCVYVVDKKEVSALTVKEEELYTWFLAQQLSYVVTDIKEVAVEEAMSWGWFDEAIRSIKSRRDSFKFYFLEALK